MMCWETSVRSAIAALALVVAAVVEPQAMDVEAYRRHVQAQPAPQISFEDAQQMLLELRNRVFSNEVATVGRRWKERREALETCNPPFVAFFGGAFDSVYKPMEGLAEYARDRWRLLAGSGWKIRFYPWDDGSRGMIDIKNHWWSYTEGSTPIILIGHSYGGDTVYRISDMLSPDYHPLVITFDPATSLGKWSSILKNPTSDRWVHVWTKTTNENQYSMSQMLGQIGGLWSHQEKANYSILLNDIEPSLHHGDVGEMFLRVERFILKKALCG